MHTGNEEVAPPTRLLRIQEVAAELGLTTRAIRYYEEIGLLNPAARSQGAYRQFDPDDVERLRYIKGLRDEAGFSLSEIAQLLEDEAARARNRGRLTSDEPPLVRRAVVDDALARVERQIGTLRAKVDRLETMIGEATARRAHLLEHRAEIDAEISSDRPAPEQHRRDAHAPTGAAKTRARS